MDEHALCTVPGHCFTVAVAPASNALVEYSLPLYSVQIMSTEEEKVVAQRHK